jgi:hypothetical protein
VCLNIFGEITVLRLVAIIVLSLGIVVVAAAESTVDAYKVDAYRVEVPVINQSEGERDAATRTALGQVIVGVAGDATVLQHPLVRRAIENAPSYVSRFNYTSERDNKLNSNNAQTNKTFDNKVKDAKSENALKLVLHYSPVAIQNLLRDAQLSTKPGFQGVVLKVFNVRDFVSFKQVQAYLKTVALISQSELVSVNKDVMLFNLTLGNETPPLKDILVLNSNWELDETSAVDPITPQLSFRWKN